MDSSRVATDIHTVLLKSSEHQESISDREAIQISRDLIHVIGDDLRSSKKDVRKYAHSVIRRAGLGVPGGNS